MHQLFVKTPQKSRLVRDSTGKKSRPRRALLAHPQRPQRPPHTFLKFDSRQHTQAAMSVNLEDFAPHILKLGEAADLLTLPRITSLLHQTKDAHKALNDMQNYLNMKVRNHTHTPSPLSQCHTSPPLAPYPAMPANALVTLLRHQTPNSGRENRVSKERMDECALIISKLSSS